MVTSIWNERGEVLIWNWNGGPPGRSVTPAWFTAISTPAGASIVNCVVEAGTDTLHARVSQVRIGLAGGVRVTWPFERMLAAIKAISARKRRVRMGLG